jgi:hypothetical protein
MKQMEQDEHEQENARCSLEEIEPVSGVAVSQYIRPSFGRNNDAIDRMEKQRQKDAEYLDQQQKRDVVNILYRFHETRLAVHRLGIREHMHEKEQPERNDARDLVQLSQ